MCFLFYLVRLIYEKKRLKPFIDTAPYGPENTLMSTHMKKIIWPFFKLVNF